MTDYTELVKELRFGAEYGCDADLIERAADAIEELVADLGDADAMTEMWMRKYEALQAQLPKRGEIVRCGECVHCYAEGFAHERNICEKHPELGNVPDDWFCADGEREVQE